MSYTLSQLLTVLNQKGCSVTLRGDEHRSIEGLATLKAAQSHQLSFLANPRYRSALQASQAGAVILSPDEAESFLGDCLITSDPYLAYSYLSHCFDESVRSTDGIHSSAVVAKTAKIASTASIAANVVIEAGAVIEERVVIGANCVIGAGAVVRKDSRLHANVTLYHKVQLGERVVVHSAAVIGSDGFGFAPQKGQWQKIAQLGTVKIGDDVEIGAGTTIDRGALEDTVLGNGVIVDNQVQIAHNVVIGDHTAVAGCVGIAGSTQIGAYCTIAGAAGIAGHLTICDRVHIAMQAQVTRSIDESGSYSSGTGLMPTAKWRKSAVFFRQMESWIKRIKEMES